jgi:Domain of unknown function (DUF3883)
MAIRKRSTDWSDEEVAICVAAYFEYLAISQSGGKFIKEQIYRDLAKQTGRSAASVSLKFQNISAVLDELGREWMKGLKPRSNYQELLANKIGVHLESLGALPIIKNPAIQKNTLREPQSFLLESAPNLKNAMPKLPDYIERLVRKFDHVARDSENRSLGVVGEEFVFHFERQQLSLAGRNDLSDNVRWVSKEDGDGAGYDILSFDGRGDKKFIEVKTTVGNSRTPFFVSRNEYEFCKHVGDSFRIIRLYDFRRAVRGFELIGELEKHVALSTESFRAEFSSQEFV